MSLFNSPEEHAANPPDTWVVAKHGTSWHLSMKDGGVLDTYARKTDAEQARHTGFLVTLYETETRWYRGETIPGWRSYADLVPPRTRP